MKSQLKPLLVAGVLFLIFFSGCRKNNHSHPYTYQMYTPILMDKSVYYSALNGDPLQPVENGGQIYITGNHIFVNDVDKGIHVIDNTDPANPRQVAFLNIPGNQGMVVKGNTLLADMFGDLLAIDITDVNQAKVTATVPTFFLNRSFGITSADSTHVIVGFTHKDTTVYVDMEEGCRNCDMEALNIPLPAGAKPQQGQAGSMAGMILMNNYLYAIAEPHSVGIADVTDPRKPLRKQSFFAGFDLETIFPFGDNLFLGSMTGMFIYNVSDPEAPARLGEFTHGRACDPVIADANTAYVTLHAGSTCGGDANELNVIDITDLMNPQLIKSYPLTGPKGLSKDGNLLFVCDGDAGVKILDATDASSVSLLQTIDVKDPYDVIANNGLLAVVAKNGVYQYDYSDIHNIRQLSSISVPVHVK